MLEVQGINLRRRKILYIVELGKAAIQGVISIPMDLAYGARRTFEDVAGSARVRLENRAERERGMRAIKMAINFGSSESGPIAKMVKIVLTEFYDFLPDSAIESIAKKAGVGTSFMAGRVSTQLTLTTLVSQRLAKEIVVKAIAQRAVKLGVGGAASALLIQGFIEKASEASKRLQLLSPKLYSKFREKNLDMAYIIIEDSMAPLLEAIRIHGKSKAEFETLIEKMLNEI